MTDTTDDNYADTNLSAYEWRDLHLDADNLSPNGIDIHAWDLIELLRESFARIEALENKVQEITARLPHD